VQRVRRAVFRRKRASVTFYSQGDVYGAMIAQDSTVGYGTVVNCRYYTVTGAAPQIASQ